MTLFRKALLLMLAFSAGAAAQWNGRNGSCASAIPADSPKPAICRDRTPHREWCVPVDRGVALQVLDWGGAGKEKVMVLLTGYGDNAHVYDQFAYHFTDDFHVIGITRRGFLPSSQPEGGYDVDTRARDDIEVLKYFGVSKAIFVGHSMAGSELSKLGLEYKSYVEKLVYLDAFDLARRFDLPEIPGAAYQVDQDYRSLQVFQAAQAKLEDYVRPVPALCPALSFDGRGRITDATTPGFVGTQLFAGIAEKNNPVVNWAQIDAPRLGLLNRPSVEAKLPHYWYLPAAEQAVFDKNWPAIVEWYVREIERFQKPNAGQPDPVVRLLPDASHYFYLTRQAFVVRAMREFLLGKMEP